MKLRQLLVAALLASPLALWAEAGNVTEAPVPVRTVAPEYPRQLLSDGVSGVVVLALTVDEQGNVIDPKVEKTSNAEFNHPAIAAVTRWRFKPAQQNGKAVAAKIMLPIRFNPQT